VGEIAKQADAPAPFSAEILRARGRGQNIAKRTVRVFPTQNIGAPSTRKTRHYRGNDGETRIRECDGRCGGGSGV
jgi:hypothetical protein